jgi:hypothetical protein
MREQFFAVCEQAKPAKGSYVSLYMDIPYYGGPEEGGWWGRDTQLVAYEWFSTEEQAEAAKERVRELAEQETEKAKQDFYERCAAECDWLDARGLEPDHLPEVSGNDAYWVAVEKEPGASESVGSRHYE